MVQGSNNTNKRVPWILLSLGPHFHTFKKNANALSDFFSVLYLIIRSTVANGILIETHEAQ